MASEKVPTSKEVLAKVLDVDAARQKAGKRLTRELKKLFADYMARVVAMLATGGSTKTDVLALADITAMMRDLHGVLLDAGFEDVLNNFAGSFPDLAHAATAYTEALGVEPSLAGVDAGALHAYVEFQTTQLAQSINQKLVPPIQSALLQANFGSLDRQTVVDQVAALEPTLTTSQATTLVDTAFAQFQRSVIVQKGEELNLEIYQYLGPDDAITSDQCHLMLTIDKHGAKGFLYKDEITADLHEDLRDNPLIAGGHPRCRHQWSPVTLAYAQEQGFKVEQGEAA
jgi:hypothetical protein